MKADNTNEELIKLYHIEKLRDAEKAEVIKKRIVERNIHMIYNRINAISNEKNNLSHEDKEDLIQTSMVALILAIETYDERKAQFMTYAYRKVQFAILDWIEKERQLIRIPKNKRKACSIYNKTVNEYKQKNGGKEPSELYIKKVMGVNSNTFRDIKAALAASNIISFDEKNNEDTETSAIAEIVPDDKDKASDVLSEKEKKRLFEIILELNDKEERQVLIDFFYNKISLEKIAEKRGKSKQVVYLIKNRALKHLASRGELKSIAVEKGIICSDT